VAASNPRVVNVESNGQEALAPPPTMSESPASASEVEEERARRLFLPVAVDSPASCCCWVVSGVKLEERAACDSARWERCNPPSLLAGMSRRERGDGKRSRGGQVFRSDMSLAPACSLFPGHSEVADDTQSLTREPQLPLRSLVLGTVQHRAPLSRWSAFRSRSLLCGQSGLIGFVHLIIEVSCFSLVGDWHPLLVKVAEEILGRGFVGLSGGRARRVREGKCQFDSLRNLKLSEAHPMAQRLPDALADLLLVSLDLAKSGLLILPVKDAPPTSRGFSSESVQSIEGVSEAQRRMRRTRARRTDPSGRFDDRLRHQYGDLGCSEGGHESW
jgi:hypothetical protein